MKQAVVPILAAFLSVLLMTFAHGADLRVLPTKAVPLPSAYDPYTGFYLGGAVGYGWDRGNLGATFPGGPADFGDLSNAPQGVLGELYLGYGHRFPGFLSPLGLDGYFGVEGSGFIGNLSGTAATPGIPLLGSGVATTNDRWLARTVARFGLIYQNVMFFGDAGWGWGGTALNISQVVNGVGTTVGSNSQTESGFSWGAGVEFPWFFGPQWKARFEYVQFDFGTNAACILTSCTVPPVIGGPVMPVIATQKNHVDAVLGGINFNF